MIHKNYFKGMYFKCEDGDKTLALIPAVHKSADSQSASVQIITDDAAHSILFDSKDELLKNCRFSMKGIKLDMCGKVNANGILHFDGITPPAYNIMGPFKYVPFMQCRHTVYSMRHRVTGTVELNGKEYTFKNGSGYIEGDSGYSFPNKYIWTHCRTPRCSLMLSAATVPFGAFSFTGVIGFVLIGRKEYRIATYLGARVEKMADGTVTIRQGEYVLRARLIKKNTRPLLAPMAGSMIRTIHESASCSAEYVFCQRGEKLLDFISDRASFESEL